MAKGVALRWDGMQRINELDMKNEKITYAVIGQAVLDEAC